MNAVGCVMRLEDRLADAARELPTDPEQVVIDLQRIEDEATTASSWSIVGRARYLRARAATESGDFSLADHLLDGAADAHTRAGDSLSAIRTALGRMHVLDSLGRHGDAIAAGERALAEIDSERGPGSTEIATSPGEQWRLLHAAIHENLGIARGLRGEHTAAMANYATARSVYSELGADEDLLRLRANQGAELIEVGRFREAVGVLGGVAEEFAALGDLWWHGVAAQYLARAHLGMGSTERAVEFAARSTEVLESVGATCELVQSRLVAAAALFATGRTQAGGRCAAAVLVDAARSARSLERGRAWLFVGLALADRGHITGAARAIGRSIAVHDDAGHVRSAARSRLARAEIALDQGGAFEDLSWVRSHLDDQEGPLELARAELIASKWFESPQRRVALQTGLDLCGRDAPSQLLAALETELGKVLWEEGNPESAEQFLRSAARRNTRRRRLLELDDQWSACDVGPGEALGALVAVLLDQGREADRSEALRISEAGKAPALARRALRESALHVQRTGAGSRLAPIDVGPAISWRDVGHSIVGFASEAGAVVRTVELDREAVITAVGQLARSVRNTILSGASQAGADDLGANLDIVGSAIGAPELIGALGLAPGDSVSVSGHAEIGSVPLASVGGLRDLRGVIERPSLAFSSPGPRRPGSTLFVDCGASDLSWRDAEREAVMMSAVSPTACHKVASLEELAEAIRDHDVIHFVGHATPGSRHRRAALEFESWSLHDDDVLELPLAGRLVILNVCEAQSLRRGPVHEPGGLATSMLASGATAVLGSHWPVVDSAAAVDAAVAIHAGLSSGSPVIDAMAAMRSEIRQRHGHPLLWAGWSIRSLAPTADLAKETSK